jgi:hypothetical protein
MAPKCDEEFPREKTEKLFGASNDAHLSSPFVPFLRLDTKILYGRTAFFCMPHNQNNMLVGRQNQPWMKF